MTSYNPITVCANNFILNPRDEHIILNSNDKQMKDLISEWNIYNQDKDRRKISLSAYVMYLRIHDMINVLKKTRTLCITSMHRCKKMWPHMLTYNFIHYSEHQYIVKEDEYLLYGVHIDDAIFIQEMLFNELFWHNIPIYRYHYHLNDKYRKIDDGLYLIRKYSAWTYCTMGDHFIMPQSLYAISYRDQQSHEESLRLYPHHIPIVSANGRIMWSKPINNISLGIRDPYSDPKHWIIYARSWSIFKKYMPTMYLDMEILCQR